MPWAMRWSASTGIGLILTALVLTGVSVLLLVGAPKGTKDMPPQGAPESADMRVYNLHLIEQADTGDGWKLRAQEAAFYAARQLVIVRQMRAQLLAQTTQPIQVEADHGHIHSATGDLTVQGHVRLQYLEGYTLATDILHWHAASRVLQTDAAVQINNAAVHIAGKGLQGHVDEQRFVIQDGVHAAFQLR